MPRITAVICTFDRYDVLPRAIAGLLAQHDPEGGFAVLVVDNSPDRERARAFGARYDGKSRLRYAIEETPGLSNARNVALRSCGTELVAFIDDDAVAAPDWLARMVEAFDAMGESAAAVGGKVVPRWAAPRPRWLHERHLGYLSIVDWGGVMREAGAHEWLAGTNLAFRVARVLATGGFSTQLGRVGGQAPLMSNEEIEVVARLRERGGRVIYAPLATVEHVIEPERLTREWFRKRAAWQAVSDMMTDSQALLARIPRELEPALERLPAGEGAWRALAADVDDAEEFSRRLRAIYWLTAGMLAGFVRGRG